jgi:hypothetical protein
MPCAGLAHNWTVLIQQAIQYQQIIFGFMAAFFYSKQYLIQDALNGCEVSTFKKNKMNSSFDNIIKSEKPVLIDFLLLGDLAKCLGLF